MFVVCRHKYIYFYRNAKIIKKIIMAKVFYLFHIEKMFCDIFADARKSI